MAGMRAVHKKNGTTFKYSGDLKETIEKAEKELKEKEGTTQWLFLKWQYDNARKAFEKYNRRLEDLKDFIKLAKEELAKRDDYKLFVLGELGRHYFEQKGINIDKQFHFVVQDPSLSRARRIAEDLLKLYHTNELDELYIIYTTMVNAMQEEAQVAQLLPLKKADFKIPVPIDIPLEGLALKPSAEEVMDHIVPNYVVGFVYGALVEAFSCEQNARMMAMEGATNSAKQMLKELDIEYNRARQAAITQEITEVIAGAKSQKKKKK